MNERLRARRSTIISPVRYIHDYHWHAFSALLIIGCLLAFVAGYVNTICVVGTFQLPLTALTGSTTKMGIVIAQGRFDIALHFFLLIFSFALGSSISAALVGGSSFKIQHHYGLVLLLEAIFLAFGSLFKDVHVSLHSEWEALSPGAYLICLGCGLQNGMCTTFSGAVIRTTHVTGMLTDIGLIIGHAIFYKRTRKHLWKLKILVPLYMSFCCGVIIGWFAFQLMQNKAIIPPCMIIGCLGLGHISYCKIFLKLKVQQIKDKNKNVSGSRRLSTLMEETVAVEPTIIPFDQQSSATDQVDSEDEQKEIENIIRTRNSLTPLVRTIQHTTIKLQDTQ